MKPQRQNFSKNNTLNYLIHKIMFKKTLSLAFAAMVALVAQAQKPVMVAGTFSAGENVEKNYALQVRTSVVAGLFETGRFELKDIDSERQIAAETERRSSEDAMNSAAALMEHTTETAAEYLLYGGITQCSVSQSPSQDGKMYYSAEITYSVKIVKYANKEVVVSKDYKLAGFRGGFGDTPAAAVMDATAHIKNDMKNLVDEYFKLEGEIIGEGYETDKKGKKMETCLITLGSDFGLEKGQRLEVSCIEKVAGRDVTKVIGQLTITEVMAGDLSQCKVTKGGDAILAKMKEYLDIKDAAPENAVPLKVKTMKQSAAKNLLKQGGAFLGM